MTTATQGRCLCGAVRITARLVSGDVSVCHCVMCRRWSGAVFAVVDAEDVTAEGPVTRYPSSPGVARAFCATCGSHLWFQQGNTYEVCTGLLDIPMRLVREIYTDQAQGWCSLSGDHQRLTRAEYLAETPGAAGIAP